VPFYHSKLSFNIYNHSRLWTTVAEKQAGEEALLTILMIAFVSPPNK